MSREQRPRRRLRTFLRLDDEQQRPKRRRPAARRDQEPQFDPAEEYTGEELIDQWAGGWPESARSRYAAWGCGLPPLPKRET